MAALLNRDFVCVKVDREERPDIDTVYMAACQALTGSGGWPLTAFLTPDQRPFFAGTYFPKHGRYGAIGLTALLPQIAALWRSDREKLLRTGEEVAGHLREAPLPPAAPSPALLEEAAAWFKGAFDAKNGGFGGAPKFPSPHNLLFLLRYGALKQDAGLLRMAERTLVQMARGGLCDQVGGGFSRYATDERWLIPHFEKMLYDNALLAYTLFEAARRSGDAFLRAAAARTVGYVLRELRSGEGAFLCGQDADSGGEEGRYYVLTPSEVRDVLGARDGDAFCAWFGVTERGNFEGASVPNLLQNPRYADTWPRMEPLCEALRRYRANRAPLHRDDKVLTSWNALMIAALAAAARTQGDGPYLEAARQARRFLWERLRTPQGRLLARWRDGEAAIPATLDDYAYTAWALLELYAATLDVSCLTDAEALAGTVEALFPDAASGGYYLTASDAQRLIHRPKELYDGALPSGNSVLALVLLRLSALTGKPLWRERADRQLAFLAGNMEHPAGHCFALLAVMESLFPQRQLVCALSGGAPEGLSPLLETPRLSALVKTRENAEALAAFAPYTAAYPVPEEGEAYYLCRDGACQRPVYSLEALRQALRR